MIQSEYSQGYNNGHSDGVKFEREQQKARDAASPMAELWNVTEVIRRSDQSVTLVFASCRAASAFEKAIKTAKGIS